MSGRPKKEIVLTNTQMDLFEKCVQISEVYLNNPITFKTNTGISPNIRHLKLTDGTYHLNGGCKRILFFPFASLIEATPYAGEIILIPVQSVSYLKMD